MKIEIDVNLIIKNAGVDDHLSKTLARLIHIGESIMATQAELAQSLKDISAQVAKIGVESGVTLQKVTDLEAALAAGGNTTPEVDAAMAALKTQVQLVDDLVPDAPAA